MVKGEGNLVIVAFSVGSVRHHSRLPYFFSFLFFFKQRNKIFIISTSGFGSEAHGNEKDPGHIPTLKIYARVRLILDKDLGL